MVELPTSFVEAHHDVLEGHRGFAFPSGLSGLDLATEFHQPLVHLVSDAGDVLLGLRELTDFSGKSFSHWELPPWLVFAVCCLFVLSYDEDDAMTTCNLSRFAGK